MLTLYRPPRKSEDSSEESDKDTIIPAGRTYFTKVNGKLVMAREKKPKAADIAIDLLGEAFGTRTTVRRRSRSVESKPVPLLLTAGTTFNPAQTTVLPYTAPIPQQSTFQTFVPNPYPPHGGPHPFIPYQPQPWNSSMIPQLPLHPHHYTVPQSKPSKEDFEALKRIDAHFNEVNSKKTKRLSSGPAAEAKVEKEVTAKTTVTITKHVCANCGRLRSRKYHMDNPLEPGAEPTPAFCKKCQKDSSETSDSDDPQGPKNPTKQANEKSKKKKSKGSSEDEPSHSPDTKEQEKLKFKKKKAGTQNLKPEYIIVEEDFSEEERILRGRQPEPKKKPEIQNTIADYIVVTEEISEEEGIPSRRQRKTKKKKSKERSPTLGYIIVEEEHSEDERTPRAKRHSLQIEESDMARRPKQRQHQRRPSGIELFPAPRPMSTREDSFGSAVSSQRSQRRRVERANLGSVPAAPWDAPHVIHPRAGDETIVVTERFVYKPKKQMEEQRREDERLSRSIKVSEEASKYYHDDWAQDQELPRRSFKLNEEATSYYHDDWAREDPIHVPDFKEERRQRTSVPGRYRRDCTQDSLWDSESTDYYRAQDAVFHDIPPRAPSPSPSPPTESRPEVAPFEDEATARRLSTPKKDKGSARGNPEGRKRHGSDASEVSSNHHPAFVREATNGGNEKALVLSPETTYSREPLYVDDDLSGMTERERIVERETKRVTFRDLSHSSVSSDSWSRRSEASESFLKRKTSWDNSAVGPVPVSGEKW